MNTNDGYWFPNLQLPKEIIFNPAQPTGSQFTINDIWPRKNPANTFDEHYQPQDNEPPWGKAEFIQDPNAGQRKNLPKLGISLLGSKRS